MAITGLVHANIDCSDYDRSLRVYQALATDGLDGDMRRLGAADDIASCIVCPASDESSYVTGAEFTVDAGMTAQ